MTHPMLLAAATTPHVTVNLGGLQKPSSSVVIIIAITLLGVAPSLLILLTGFTQFLVVLGITRNALGLQNIPPNQVLAGIALFLALFAMGPTLAKVDHVAVQPYLSGRISASTAFHDAEHPVEDYMLRNTRRGELDLFVSIAHEHPKTPQQTPITTVIPAFLLSELKSAFIAGFVIFLPFMVIDLVVSSILMSMGIYMLPPTLISLPFKILLFVLVDGWALLVQSLVLSFH